MEVSRRDFLAAIAAVCASTTLHVEGGDDANGWESSEDSSSSVPSCGGQAKRFEGLLEWKCTPFRYPNGVIEKKWEGWGYVPAGSMPVLNEPPKDGNGDDLWVGLGLYRNECVPGPWWLTLKSWTFRPAYAPGGKLVGRNVEITLVERALIEHVGAVAPSKKNG